MYLYFLEISFTPYIPSTIIGLVGLCSGYFYFYFKNKNDNKLEEIKSISSKDRLKAIELYLNEIGTPIDTSNLDPQDKYKLLLQSLHIKTKRYLMISVVAIIISLVVGFLIWNSQNQKTNQNPVFADTTTQNNKKDTSSVPSLVTKTLELDTNANSNSISNNSSKAQNGVTTAEYVDANGNSLKDIEPTTKKNIIENENNMFFNIKSFEFSGMNEGTEMHSLSYDLTNRTGNVVKNVILDFNLQGQWLKKWIIAAAMGLQEKKVKEGLTNNEESQLSTYKAQVPYNSLLLDDKLQLSGTATLAFGYKKGENNIIKVKADWDDINNIHQSKMFEYNIDRNEAYGHFNYTWTKK